MNRSMMLLVLGAVLLVVGIIAVVITEPAGEEGSDASGGVADASEETRPYLWPGIILMLAGVVLVVLGLRGRRSRK